MNIKGIKCLLFFAYCSSLFIACGNDDKTERQEELKGFMSGKYFLGTEEGTWLKKSGNDLYEIADPYLGGSGPVITGTFWFTDENTLLTPAVLSESAIIETSLDFKWEQYLHETGEKITLLVKSNYRYDPLTGRFSTDNQSLVREKGGSSYYVERISGKDFTMRIEFKEPIHEDLVDFRVTYKEYLSPDRRPDPHYKIFDSNDEAITYVKKLLGE